MGFDASHLKALDCTLRLFVIPLSIASIWLSVTNQQNNISYGKLEFINFIGLKSVYSCFFSFSFFCGGVRISQ
uniref:UPF0497 membrane protein 16 n=1 Tax=Solanum tuberosum TaxID=4113 RepID=M1CP27_SOLTU